MGWLSLIVVYQLAIKLAIGGVTLLAVGGVVYSLGVIFYVCKRIPYNHAIWHGFVLGGSVCHFWPSICMWDRRNSRMPVPDGGAVAPYPAYESSTCEPDGVALSGYPAFNVISLFQRVRQRDDMQGVGIVANA